MRDRVATVLFRRQLRPAVHGGFLAIVELHHPNLPVFMAPAYGDADTMTTALARGADEFFTKPMDFPKLIRDIMAVNADAMRRDA